MTRMTKVTGINKQDRLHIYRSIARCFDVVGGAFILFCACPLLLQQSVVVAFVCYVISVIMMMNGVSKWAAYCQKHIRRSVARHNNR